MRNLTNSYANSIPQACKYNLIPSSNYFIPINRNDLYYIFVSTPFNVTESCYDKESITHNLSNSGLLTLNKNCQINTDQIHLRTRNDYKLGMDAVELLNVTVRFNKFDEIVEKMATLNQIEIPKFHKTTLIDNTNSDLNELSRYVDKLIEKFEIREKFEQLRNDDYYHTLGSIVIVMIFLIIAVIAVIVYFKRKLCSSEFWDSLENKFEEQLNGHATT